jgi:hypothetical protein
MSKASPFCTLRAGLQAKRIESVISAKALDAMTRRFRKGDEFSYFAAILLPCSAKIV